MKLPFDTHKIYVTLDDPELYQLHPDFSKTVINKDEVFNIDGSLSNSRLSPSVVIHKFLFDDAKAYLLNKDNPFRISKETAEVYYKIGFLSKNEYENYLKEE